jgi:hypothetical protein
MGSLYMTTFEKGTPLLAVERDSKNGLNFISLYFLNYTWYVNDLHNI